MKKLFENVRKLSSSSSSHSNFNLRRLSLSSVNSMPQIKVLRGGYNIDLQKVDSSFTKLHKAVYLNNEDRVKKYLGQIGVNSIDNYNRSPLHFAAVNGNMRIIKMLIVAGAKVDIQDADGRSPLIKAIECGHNEVVRMLMDTGANVDLADYEKGNTALHHCLLNANLECALYIIRNALIIDYNKRNHKKETFLHLAAKIPDLYTVIEELIANGIEIEATDELGRTAAQTAKLHNNNDAYELITRYANAKYQCHQDQSDNFDVNDSFSNHKNLSISNENKFQQNGDSSSSIIYDNIDQIHLSPNLNKKMNNRDEQSLDSNFRSQYRFSGFFEDTIEEENGKDMRKQQRLIMPSNNNHGSRVDEESKPKVIVNSSSSLENEPLYSNCDQSREITLLVSKCDDVDADISNYKENLESKSGVLSDNMSDLDEMLNKDLNVDIAVEVKSSNLDFNNIICFQNEIDDTMVVYDEKISDRAPNSSFKHEVLSYNNGNNSIQFDDIRNSRNKERDFCNDYNDEAECQNSKYQNSSSSPTIINSNAINFADTDCSKPKSYAEVVASPQRKDTYSNRLSSENNQSVSNQVFLKNIISEEKNLKMTNGKFTRKDSNKRSKRRSNANYSNDSKMKQNILNTTTVNQNKNYVQSSNNNNRQRPKNDYSMGNNYVVFDDDQYRSNSTNSSPRIYDTNKLRANHQRRSSTTTTTTTSSSSKSYKKPNEHSSSKTMMNTKVPFDCHTKQHKNIQTNILHSNEYKYVNLINSLKHVLSGNCEQQMKLAESSDEMALFKCISKLLLESKQNQLELELKNKEIVLMKQNVEKLQTQIEHDRKYCNELETRIANMDNNKNVDHNANVLVDFLKEQHQLKTKHYETILNEQLNENFALKKQCHFLKELIQVYELSNKNDEHKNGVESGFNYSSLVSTTHQLTRLFQKFDEKLSSFNEILQQRIKNIDEEIRLRQSFIKQFQEEISNLKLFTSQVVAFGFGLVRNDSELQQQKQGENQQQQVRRHSEQVNDLNNIYHHSSCTDKSSLKLSSNRKSFSLHDLTSLGNDCSNIDSYIRPYHTTSRNDANIDYSNSFSYKSKYFQRKINELRKQLGYVN